MANEKWLIDRNEIFPNGTFFANAEDPLKSLDELIKRIWSIPTVDAVPAEQFNTLKSFVNGEWVDCKLLQEALGIDFATGLKMFNFSRTAEWNPAPLNGQKINTKFRIKNAVEVVHGRWLKTKESLGWNEVDCVECSICHASWLSDEDDSFDYLEHWHYCPNCGAKMDGDGND